MGVIVDTTPKYVKMCEKAEETQKQWVVTEGDFVMVVVHAGDGYTTELYPEIGMMINSEYGGFRKAKEPFSKWWIHFIKPRVTYAMCNVNINHMRDTSELFWLPTQDQLQEMVKKPPFELLDDFHETINEYGEYPYIGGMGCAVDGWSPADKFKQFTSFEQLWLAFVMCKKYDKHWDNKKEEWVK